MGEQTSNIVLLFDASYSFCLFNFSNYCILSISLIYEGKINLESQSIYWDYYNTHGSTTGVKFHLD